jgi:hypothetical protein
MTDVQTYWDAVRVQVCTHCIDSDRAGGCRLAGPTVCGLKRYFSTILESVLSVESDSLGPYVKALRENVCSICEHQSADGACLVRTDVDCGLDRYFPMVVEIIETLRVEEKGRITQLSGIR